MSSLADLQASMQGHLLGKSNDIIGELSFPRQGALTERLAVYANGYRSRLIDALQKEYTYLYEYLDEDVFAFLCDTYIDKYPSRFFSISEFVKHFPKHIFEQEPSRSYLGELAQLINALSCSIESADTQLLSYAVLAKIPIQNWPSLCFKCHPSVHCLSFRWNTFSLWKALVQKKILPTMVEVSSHCIVWRKELKTYALELSEAEAVVIRSLESGTCFADICELVCNRGLVSENTAANLLANCLTRWINDHLISEVYTV